MSRGEILREIRGELDSSAGGRDDVEDDRITASEGWRARQDLNLRPPV